MKITIEPSEDQHDKNPPYSKVSVESPYDDLTIGQMMEEIVKALKAWGYANESIGEYLDEGFALEHGLISEPPTGKDKPPLKDNNWIDYSSL